MVEVRGNRIKGRRRGRKIKMQIRKIKEKAEEEKSAELGNWVRRKKKEKQRNDREEDKNMVTEYWQRMGKTKPRKRKKER
jgi:hypothetical protein